MFEIEVLPPGHPITHDIELDVVALKKKHEKG
jgi:acetophenone carboxylase